MESLGLIAIKPVPDRGIDLEVYNPSDLKKCIRIQVKGRSPKQIDTHRWFQIRVPKREFERARQEGIPANQTWRKKVKMVDFFILDAVNMNEMWVLNQDQVFDLISLNEQQYSTRPDNIFVYDENMNSKQKEMNLEARVMGPSIMNRLGHCKNNFQPILDSLGM
jgi:hypothetical protein